jgi:hypothetical protein
MKAIKFLLGLGLMVASSSVFSQGLQGIVVEKYYQAQTADLASANANIEPGAPALTTNSVTYRVYADLATGYKVNAIYGDLAHPANFTTTTGFYNHNAGADVLSSPSTLSQILQNSRLLDSYLTIGAVCSGKVGVIEAEDNDGALTHTNGLLQNNPGGSCFGDPIFGTNAKDGMVASSGTTFATVSAVGLGGTILDALGANGGSVVSFNDGSYYTQNGIVGPASSTTNKVLIGQFTTDGEFSFAINIQVGLATGGGVQYYVSSNPTGSELTLPSLTLAPNAAPTVSVVGTIVSTGAVAGGNIINGTAMKFTATAADNVSVTDVKFYDGATLLSTDATAPYEHLYTAVQGSHTITAVATDDQCVTTTSTPYAFTSAANQAPTVTVTAPTTTVAGTVLTFTASASDVDGTVSQVEFFVNNVSVGVDTSTPYSVTYTAVLGSGQTVKAVATDDLGLTATSNIVTMNVLANVPATVSLTGPSASGIYSSYVSAAAGTLTPMTFTADAADSDGTVTQVEFFVDGVSVGVDATTPYSVIWNSTSGTKVVTAKATDSNGAITTSATLTLVINDLLALPYEVVSVSQTCELPTYCVPVAAALTNPVNDVKGYDVVMNYDATKVVPTGNVTVYSALVNPALIDVATSWISGELTISLSFKGTAPANSEFNGTGNLFCAEFTRLAGLAPFDQSQVSVSFMQESYITGVQQKPVTANNIFSTTQQNYVANLQYGFDGSAISYNAAAPNAFLVTNIYGATGTTINNPTTPVTPNVAGQFTHNLGNGTNVSIQRDINNLNTIQLIVNAADAIIAKTLLLNQYTSATAPSIYAMLSMDVNLDGVISSGDLTQMKQRTTLAIPEYQQAWNYNNQGVSNGQASKDWIFVDATRVATAAYQISSTFPANNLIGYSKGKVPVVPFELAANQTGYSVTNATCPLVLTENYKGVMLGDADGSYGAYAADGILKTNESDYILVDLGNAIVEGTTVSVPVAFVSEEPVNAFDIALQVNENKLTYVSMEDTQLGSESDAFYNNNDKTFRYTALNMNDFSSNARVVYITFETADGKITEKDLTAELGLLNGKQTEVRFVKSIQTGDNAIDIFPNPSNGMFTVMSHEDGQVDIVDIAGKLVFPGAIVKANQVVEVNMPELSAGVYFVRFYSNNALTTKRIVISE